jgi:hypothetical protein
MPSSTFNFERTIPAMPWRRIGVVAAVLATIATASWELHARRAGYAPTLNDSEDLWAQQRDQVKPDSIVIIGDSRPLFDLDLGILGEGLGQRPIQLALAGSCAYPVLDDLAKDASFHGTVIASIVPIMWLAPGGPLVGTSQKALERRSKRTWAQRASHELGMGLEEHVAFLKSEDLTLAKLLEQVEVPNREGAQVGPAMPPYFQSCERDRQTRMFEGCARPGALQTRVKEGWLPLFTPPPPPTFVPKEAFLAEQGARIEQRFHDTQSAVESIRARGGKVVFVRFPVGGKLKELEDRATPREGPWTRILAMTGAPGIYFEDYPELSAFEPPEWSHLSATDAREFSRRLVPHIKEALAK